ncbi:nuclear receptor-interacting protein 1 [Ornithorhynchus anatinus]|uniref:Nuclear receptor interacting protein 1 n=1 Tax=Ornithorhynchus anatinus TaxID=9258 RepID=F6PM77_ORNAN|nr:nuclear receptor-interacting protein 1 [Ornithorhynchus anatinus]XP_028938076.1 nuclear receptor-interacting protein 1 [Ornithorhynchus anatinus]XP_028938077.1 nuclear receptor-interacting protein 1 [Ornithorhynchus anatinus]
MTHGEELGSDMHQDSIVLTYLEGLLMHQATGGSSPAVDHTSTGPSGDDQNFKISGNLFPTCQSNGPSPNPTSSYQGSGMLHLKKARLLQSSEDWNAAKRRRLSDSIVDLNVKKEALLAGMVENVPKGKQDSTLLASLLQSFSSRLQSVALSQQIRQSLREQGYSLSHDPLKVEKDLRCYGVASSHLKTLLKKSKAKDQKPEAQLSDITKTLVKDRFIEAPHPGQNGAKVMNEPLSCAARLQAVASMVEKRASPTPSPKPSVACSQLALLLSSEAHLQQYSREHALKAQNANQVASERLAAMARLQESGQKEQSPFPIAKGMPGHLNGHPRTPPSKAVPGKISAAPFPNPVGVLHSPPKSGGYKSPLERNHLKQPANNSLLLHLLKSQSVAKPTNGHDQAERSSMFEDGSTPTTLDECSDHNPSFTEDDSSGDESSHSNCVPIDLSFKHRVEKPDSAQATSLENLTQSLLNTWDPKVPGLEIKEDRDPAKNAKLNPHQKVTLLQLLLGHKTEESPERKADPQGSPGTADLPKFSVPTKRTPVTESPSVHRATPLNTPPLLTSPSPGSPINLSQHSFVTKRNSPPYTCHIQPERLMTPASKHLVDLTKSKELQGTKPIRNESSPNPATFSASKLLQNLAQCGMQSSMSGEEQRTSKQLLNVNADKPVGLIDRLNSPLLPNKSLEEAGKVFNSQLASSEPGLSGSEIENLLERRTVLQLLLGNSNKGKNEKKERIISSRAESPPEPTDRPLSEQILTVKIKTEPGEDLHVIHPAPAHPVRDGPTNTFLGMAPAVQRSAAASPASEDFKLEPLSPQDFSFSKNGLLSRLLRQNQDSYASDDLDRSHRPGELTLLEPRSLCTVPKKRKLQPEPGESPLRKTKGPTSDVTNHPRPSTEPPHYGPTSHQDEVKLSRSELEPKYLAAPGSSTESDNRSWPRDSKGFNVLKQLLLSENCVRDLSQPRGGAVPEGKRKGARSGGPNGKPEFSMAPLNGLMGAPPQANSCVENRTFQYPVAVQSPTSLPFHEHLGCSAPRQESGQLSVCPVPGDKGPIRWVITGVDKSDYEKDSPRLTKTNPILYYMLQKGGNSTCSQEVPDKDMWNESPFAESPAQMAIKEEFLPGAETKAPFLNLRGPYGSPLGSKAPRPHNTNGEIYGLLEKVLTIKKEAE